MAVVIETTLGDITVDLYLDQRPVSCLNFLKLCKMKYFNFNLFHTIRSGFIAQTGDPTGEGSGGQSIFGILEGPEKRFFSGEKMPKIRHTNAGLLSMVCSDDMMIGSQFFFTLASDLDSLDGVHCVIGEVTEGHEILRKLNEVICDETHRPYQDVRITHTVILDDPFNDPPGFHTPSRSPSPSAERLKGGRIAPDEEIDETQGKTAEEIQEIIEEKEAKARATILEIVGDLPDADIAPPENVLFVCKLNPVTTDEDLEIIFSRFGKIVSCEVIRDKKTGDSLQYAFIEFSDKKSCEDAYFKMDNVLIDDRRIHVDFSQSVSKMRWLGKGRGVQHFDDDGNIKGNQFQSKYNQDHDKDHKRERHNHRHRGERDRSPNNRYKSDRVNERKERMQSRDYSSRKSEKTERHRRRSRSEENNERRKKYVNEKQNKVRSRSKSEERLMSKHEKSRNRPTNHRNNDSISKSRQYDKSQVHRASKSDMNYSDKQRNNRSKSPTRYCKDKNVEVLEQNNDVGRKHSNNNNNNKRHKSHSRDDLLIKKLKLDSKKEKSDITEKTVKKKHNKHVEPQTPSPAKEKINKTVKKQSENTKDYKKRVVNKKKKRRPSTSSSETDSSESSSSSTESSSSSDSDNRNKKRSRRKRKYSSSSSSESSDSTTSSSSSDSSSSTSSSSDSEIDRKRAKKTKKKIVKKAKKKA
ncbi:unnamed protein product [Diatraea saccharalis]|uniref:Peptidyl-prolyl cis-trans isomerase n=1 Tax=Diatraea saccharalis TaxID=40085 RepID=A0A9N9WC95_9NEOP|nr:unnamed protein product [Diatraea saccharalis]